MVSSELPEILAIADRILVLAEGRMTAEFTRDEATEEAILKAALPVGRPTGNESHEPEFDQRTPGPLPVARWRWR